MQQTTAPAACLLTRIDVSGRKDVCDAALDVASLGCRLAAAGDPMCGRKSCLNAFSAMPCSDIDAHP